MAKNLVDGQGCKHYRCEHTKPAPNPGGENDAEAEADAEDEKSSDKLTVCERLPRIVFVGRILGLRFGITSHLSGVFKDTDNVPRC